MFARTQFLIWAAALAICTSTSLAQDDGTGFVTACKPGFYSITFDDGPGPYTERLLDILATAGVKTTFFIQGEKLENETWARATKRAHDEGHQIASHTYTHPDLNTLTEAAILEEMTKNDAAIKNVTGVSPHYMRPPFGNCGPVCSAVMQKNNYTVTTWNIDSQDWTFEKDVPGQAKIIPNMFMEENKKLPVANTPNYGYISLQHDIHDYSVDRVAEIIKEIKAKGFQMTTVEGCLAAPPNPMYRGGVIGQPPAAPASPSSAAPSAPTEASNTDTAKAPESTAVISSSQVSAATSSLTISTKSYMTLAGFMGALIYLGQ